MTDSVRMIINNDHHRNNPNFNSWHGLSGSASNGNSTSNTPTPNSAFRRSSTSTRSSMRKILPPTPDMDTQMNLSAKMIDRRTSTPKGYHSYGPFFLEYSLLAEYNLLQKQRIPGIYIIPSANSPLCWFGVIFVRNGVYQEGVFKFKIIIPENFPDGESPSVFFDHFVYHVLVDPKSFELDVRRAFPKWKRNVNHLWQIVYYIRKCFLKFDTTNPINKEASQLFTENPKSFQKNVDQCINEWKTHIYDNSIDDDPHAITFSPYDDNIHGAVLKSITDASRENSLSPSNCESSYSPTTSSFGSINSAKSSSGLSFLDSGSLQIFSRNKN